MGGTQNFADKKKHQNELQAKQYHFMNLIIDNSECLGPNFETVRHLQFLKEFFM